MLLSTPYDLSDNEGRRYYPGPAAIEEPIPVRNPDRNTCLLEQGKCCTGILRSCSDLPCAAADIKPTCSDDDMLGLGGQQLCRCDVWRVRSRLCCRDAARSCGCYNLWNPVAA